MVEGREKLSTRSHLVSDAWHQRLWTDIAPDQSNVRGNRRSPRGAAGNGPMRRSSSEATSCTGTPTPEHPGIASPHPELVAGEELVLGHMDVHPLGGRLGRTGQDRLEHERVRRP